MANIVLILNWKVEPLMMTSCVRVNTHIETELALLSLHNHIQITWFKITVKNVGLAS